MTNYFEIWKKRRALRRYRERLPASLSKDYGRLEYYTPAQVLATLERQRLSSKYTSWAVALFCTNESFSKYSENSDTILNYDEARLELASILFSSKEHFRQIAVQPAQSVAAGPNDSVGAIGGGDSGGGE